MTNTARSWQDLIVGERATIDRQFHETVQNSSLSLQSWELVMTATEFEITMQDDPKTASIVPNIDRLDSVLPSIASIEQAQRSISQSKKRGVIAQVKAMIGLGDPYEVYRAEAERLTTAYAQELQHKLEQNGRWENIVNAAM